MEVFPYFDEFGTQVRHGLVPLAARRRDLRLNLDRRTESDRQIGIGIERALLKQGGNPLLGFAGIRVGGVVLSSLPARREPATTRRR